MTPALTLAGFLTVSAAAYDPYTAYVLWSDGMRERIATTSPAACAGIAEDVRSRRWRPVGRDGRTIVSLECRHENTLGATCIAGFNCARGR